MSNPAFRTDVNIRGPTSQTLLDRPNISRGQSSTEYLDGAAENVNKQIDNDIKAMLDAFEALVGLSRIRDKDKYRIAQETFELEARSDVMVRAAQSLTLLSNSLKLSLLLSQEPIDSPEQEGDMTLDEEAIQLIKDTSMEKQRCARILEQMFDLDIGEGEGEEEEEVVGEKDQKDGVSAGSEAKSKDAEEPTPREPSPGKGVVEEEDLEMEAVE